MLQLGAVKMPSKLEITGEGGAVFNWYSPQNGMELRHPVKLLASSYAGQSSRSQLTRQMIFMIQYKVFTK